MALLAVLDYEIGNLRSAQKAFEHLGADARLTADPGLVRDANALVLPGVGAFGPCMAALARRRLDGLVVEAVETGVPFLGICIGMQMLFEGSDESPGTPGLGLLPGRVRSLPDGVKRPQMQWNRLDLHRPSTMLHALPDPAWVYFVHSFAAETDDPDLVTATCDYGGPVVAAVERDRVWAVQFHPEKSGATGLAVLKGFLDVVEAGR